MSDEFTPEETAAMSEMAQDTAPVSDAEMSANPAEVTAAPAPVQEAADPAKPPEGFVPHGALHQERERRKALEAQFEELKAQFETIKNPPKPEPELNIPDPILDPEGFKRFQIDQIKAQNDRVQQFENQRKQEAAAQQRLQTAAQMEQQFASTTPDYNDAVKHLVSSREAELRTYGYQDQMIRQIIARDANDIFDNAVAAGRNPAELLYAAAKQRGFGAAAAAPNAGDQMQALARAQANTGSLATAGGGAQQGKMTMETLARMSDTEVGNWSRQNPAEWRALMGA